MAKRPAHKASLGTPLGRLAAQYGIEPGFRDARGQHIVTSQDTQAGLLRSMGVDASSKKEVTSALAAAKEAKDGSILPPVVVARDPSCLFNVRLRADVGDLAWRIRLEDGSERHGRLRIPGAPSTPPKSLTQGRLQERRISLPDLPLGYHRLELPDFSAATTLIVAPEKCWLPDGIDAGRRLWGIAVQLYLVQSDANWGIGDFGDLGELVRVLAARHCDVIGLNPLHQMFLDAPEHASPYSPATRLYLNALYIDISNIPELPRCRDAQQLVASSAFQASLQSCRGTALVDYTAVAKLKSEVLRLLFRSFSQDPVAERTSAFARFRAERGARLERSSLFQALRQYFSGAGADQADWHRWPQDFQNSSSQAVTNFAQENSEEIAFISWLQFVADEQLGAAARGASEAGMAIGLYRDLAVGCDRSGAETWANPRAFLDQVQVGAPPDIFNPAGQNWGLPPFDPNGLRREAYRSFIELVRANMRHAGGLRIDHVMGLQHLYCIPEGHREGAYVSYPIDDLLGILALESHRHRCMVVGEDLGTVPEGFREKMAATNIFSYRVLFFEQAPSSGAYLSPEEYPRLSVAVAGSHDLPTLKSWWAASDIDLKARLGLYPSNDELDAQRARRAEDRHALVKAMKEHGVLQSHRVLPAEEFVVAAHEYLARTSSALVIAQLDDMTGEAEPVNVPATSTEHPNWRRKYSKGLSEIASEPELWRSIETMRTVRGASEQETP
jgi:4-alpha-glucanotransferase